MILRLRVRRGAKWLDAHCPGWYNGPGAWKVTGETANSISLDLLDLADGSKCVLAQLDGYGYSNGCNEAERNSNDFEARRLGFEMGQAWPEGLVDVCYGNLTRHWKREIRKRRRAQTRILEDAERAKERA